MGLRSLFSTVTMVKQHDGNYEKRHIHVHIIYIYICVNSNIYTYIIIYIYARIYGKYSNPVYEIYIM